MMTSIPPRLRAPLEMAVIGSIAVAVGGAVHGWVSVISVAPVVIAVAVGYYVWAGKDSDFAAVIRHQPDERQVDLRLKMQALVGRVMSAAAAVAYFVAVAAHAALWPFVILVCLPAVTFFAGWMFYRDRGAGRDDSSPIEHS